MFLFYTLHVNHKIYLYAYLAVFKISQKKKKESTNDKALLNLFQLKKKIKEK